MSRSLVVGTAGHIDHGKSALVLALTGTDPDRLVEEKKRGITIELGFAHADVGGGVVASFVDVPGHERFVRTMLAGAHGFDAVMLVVAADESVMPQTREHFDICRLLGVSRGLVALTKCDAADEDLQSLAEMEVRELVAGSFLDGAPILRVSARTGQGLDVLRSALQALAAATPPRSATGPAVLPVDRAFTLRGFGTVVTGTLRSGTLAVGDELELMPAARRVRVRGLHVHGAAAERVLAGSRAAVNLSPLDLVDVARGDVLATVGAVAASSALDVDVTLLPGATLADRARVRVHVGTAEATGRVRLRAASEIQPGAKALAQIRLERPLAAVRGQRLVLRAWSPPSTLGGALVLDPAPLRRRQHASDVPRLSALRDAPPANAAATLLDDAGPMGLSSTALAARAGLSPPSAAPLVRALPSVIDLGGDPALFVSGSVLPLLEQATLAALKSFHERDPLKAGMPREELRVRVFRRAAPGLFEHALPLWHARGVIRAAPDVVALASHRVTLSTGETELRETLLSAARAARLEGITPAGAAKDPKAAERIARVLLAEGALRRVGEVLVDASALDSLRDQVRLRWPPGTRLDVAGFKELTGLSRKFVIPLLEYLDRERVTRRSGADRIVLGAL